MCKASDEDTKGALHVPTSDLEQIRRPSASAIEPRESVGPRTVTKPPCVSSIVPEKSAPLHVSPLAELLPLGLPVELVPLPKVPWLRPPITPSTVTPQPRVVESGASKV